MFRVKTLDKFMLQTFLPLFVMTFLICTFIVLMQFLWQHINDLVGKGLSLDILGELFFYAALSMVPLALPLAVLLASLMTFGNLGESFELTALKAGGISLFRVMRPLIWLMVCIAIGAFFFQNNVLPVAQTRMWTLLKSMRMKSPELDINEGEFNYQLPNINIYVNEKNRDTGVLYDVVIYDLQQGFERSRVILADSATLTMTPDKTHLYLSMFSGELFENLRDATGMNATARNQLYRSEQFDRKEIMVAFDANFNRMDDSEMGSLYIGKNVTQLAHSIDSIHAMLDSIGTDVATTMKSEPMLRLSPERTEQVSLSHRLDLDSIINEQPTWTKRRYYSTAQGMVQRKQMEYLGRSIYMDDERSVLRRHGVEMQKKFTLSLACIIFFFIGAPLGAIIRKGGLGTPLVISVLLFIFYYIIDNTGMKMAKDGKWPVWEGMWLSSAVLLPLGIFVTYKAVHDSAVFNSDAWRNAWRRLINREKRSLALKEVIIEEVVPTQAEEMLMQLRGECEAFLAEYPGRQSYAAYWLRGAYPSRRVQEVVASLELTVSYLSNSRSLRVLNDVNALPMVHNFRILHPGWGRFFAWFFPLGLPIWLIGLAWQQRFKKKLQLIITESDNILKNGF